MLDDTLRELVGRIDGLDDREKTLAEINRAINTLALIVHPLDAPVAGRA